MRITNIRALFFMCLIINFVLMHGMFLKTARTRAPQVSVFRSNNNALQRMRQPVFIPKKPSLSVWFSSFLPFTHAGSIRRDAIQLFDYIEASPNESIIRNPQTGRLEYSIKGDKNSISQEEFVNAKLSGEVIDKPENYESTVRLKDFIHQLEGLIFILNFSSTGHNRLVFDDEALYQAKKLLLFNKGFINKEVQEDDYSIDWHGLAFSRFPLLKKLRVADRILNVILDEKIFLNQGVDSLYAKINFALLLYYVVGLGGTLTPENIPYFEEKYNDLMDTYKKIYADNGENNQKAKTAIEELFVNLDPVGKRLMPESKEMFDRARTERRNIKKAAFAQSLRAKSTTE